MSEAKTSQKSSVNPCKALSPLNKASSSKNAKTMKTAKREAKNDKLVDKSNDDSITSSRVPVFEADRPRIGCTQAVAHSEHA